MAGRPPTKTVWVRVKRFYNNGVYGMSQEGEEKEILKVFYDMCETKFKADNPFELIERPTEKVFMEEDPEDSTEPDGEGMDTKSMESPENK